MKIREENPAREPKIVLAGEEGRHHALKTVEKVLKFHIEQRQVPFLISKEALECNSLWCKFQFHDRLTSDVLAPFASYFGTFSGNMSRTTRAKALAEYKRAMVSKISKRDGYGASLMAAPALEDPPLRVTGDNTSQAKQDSDYSKKEWKEPEVKKIQENVAASKDQNNVVDVGSSTKEDVGVTIPEEILSMEVVDAEKETEKEAERASVIISEEVAENAENTTIVWSCIGWEMDQLEQKRQKTVQFGDFHAEQSSGATRVHVPAAEIFKEVSNYFGIQALNKMAQILAASPTCQMKLTKPSPIASSKLWSSVMLKQKKQNSSKLRSFKVMALQSDNSTINRVESLLNLDTKPFTDRIIAEYIWIGGSGIDLRSKSRTLEKPVEDPSELPKWNYDGSSTGQAPGEDSEVILYPQAIFRDPFRGGNNILVICDTYTPAGEPIPTNKRARAAEIFSNKKVNEEIPWFGIEQEYTLLQPNVNWPLGWPVGAYPGPQGPYYCGVGAEKSWGRDISDAHYKACLYAGINISGTNGEVMPGQVFFFSKKLLIIIL
ncbi:hypothetical protein F2Q68_00039655 [Brassica cretica]|uniref:glutamine synthetase n=1 Tax=Brassica cretica TaxID=69181 RepID=A0A8S9MLV9_BRACR|nr:hypothetical protein F2Q68_00039655 [Brassica cretica]